MQVLLILTSTTSIFLIGMLVSILASPYSRRAWAIWLLTTATAMDERRAAVRAINAERKIREDEMRVSYGLNPISPFRENKTLDVNRVS